MFVFYNYESLKHNFNRSPYKAFIEGAGWLFFYADTISYNENSKRPLNFDGDIISKDFKKDVIEFLFRYFRNSSIESSVKKLNIHDVVLVQEDDTNNDRILRCAAASLIKLIKNGLYEDAVECVLYLESISDIEQKFNELCQSKI